MSGLKITGSYNFPCLNLKTNSKQEKVLSAIPDKSFSSTNSCPLSLIALKNYNLSALSFGNQTNFSESSLIIREFSDYRKENAENILGFIEKKNLNPSETRNLLEHIISDKELSKSFITEITAEPRKSAGITKTLVNKLGGKSNFSDWYYSKKGYKQAYQTYTENKVEKAKAPEELLKISPNWSYWAFSDKFGKDFTFGELPKDFQGVENYRELVKQLLNNNANIENQELKGGASGKRSFSLKVGNKKYVLKAQNDFLVYSEGLRNAVKQDPWLEDTFLNNYKENEAMKSDSCFLNAMIDGYLNLNNCDNAIKMHFFDAKTGSVLYEYAEGEKYKGDLNILNVNGVLPDLNKLGIVYNDVSTDNLKVKDDKIKIIDSGESTFIDVLKPTVPNYQFELPNWSGNGITSVIAGLGMILD